MWWGTLQIWTLIAALAYAMMARPPTLPAEVPLHRHSPTEQSLSIRDQIMWMAPSGQAETQSASLVQAPARTRAPVPSWRSKQP